MFLRPSFAFLACLAAALPAAAATRAQMLTPMNTSVLGGESRVYSARFTNAGGAPAVGETVVFSNDACGFFQNGQFTMSVPTDANGVASATFTARGSGISCWIVASAGASVRFNVFTYTAAQVYIDGQSSPARPRPGESFTFTAGAYQGVYPLYESDVTARVIPGSISATISPGAGNMGQAGGVDFEVAPEDRIGDFEIEVEHRGLKRRFRFEAPASPLQDMWWGGPMENGWGMSVVQHEDRLFAVVYTYNALGRPVWFVMPGGTWNEEHTEYSGPLYFPTGTPFSSYDASRLVVNAPVGTARIAFSSASSATLHYTIEGVSASKSIRRQLFGPAQDGAPIEGVGDMWWGGAQQNGWGIALLQQYKSLFAVWFTYDANGVPTWFVMPAGTWATLSSYEGRIYRATGSPWLGQPYDPNKLAPVDVGSFKFRFDASGAASFDYSVDGRGATLPLSRQGF